MYKKIQKIARQSCNTVKVRCMTNLAVSDGNWLVV